MIYLDNNATTRLDPHVLNAMMPFLTDSFANAASTHPFGVSAHEAVKAARQQVADLIKADPHEIVFTSGATEAINLAIKGIAEQGNNQKRHIITVQTEHKAVLDVCSHLETRGFAVTYLPVRPHNVPGAGLVDLADLQAALRPDTLLVAVMWANNETGVIQPIADIARMAHEAGALFMTDATQAVGKLPIDIDAAGVDLLTFSAHKFYGPKGVGGLYVRQHSLAGTSARKVRLEAVLHGGGHERGLRSGTLNVPGIVGMGAAAAVAPVTNPVETQHIASLRDQLETALLTIPGTSVNGDRGQRLYNTTNICFEHCDSDALIMGLEGIAVSNGSACTAASIDPSHVLLAMALDEQQAFNCLRFRRFTFEVHKGDF
jgi:cysteine desulfurase